MNATLSISIARTLLKGLPRNEATVRDQLVQLIRAMGLGEPQLEYRSGSGPIDTYLPERKVVIEIKKPPLAQNPHSTRHGTGETPYEQLCRYVLAERAVSQAMPNLYGDRKAPWIGILTDGKHWHGWKWPENENEREGQPR